METTETAGKEKSKISKAQQHAVERYNVTNYDRLWLRVKKGERALIQAKASEKGKSVNAFILDAVRAAMEE